MWTLWKRHDLHIFPTNSLSSKSLAPDSSLLPFAIKIVKIVNWNLLQGTVWGHIYKTQENGKSHIKRNYWKGWFIVTSVEKKTQLALNWKDTQHHIIGKIDQLKITTIVAKLETGEN